MMTKIKKARQKKGLTQLELAEMTQIPLRTLQKWDNGENTPKKYIENYIMQFLK
jgi:DNA-binding transcriptional regulator YiaG